MNWISISFSDLKRSANWLLTRSRNCSQTFRTLVGEGLDVGETDVGSETAVVGAGLDVADGVVVLVAVPAFQMSFFPDLIHVKVLFPSVCLEPILVQAAPPLTAEKAGVGTNDVANETAINAGRSRFIASK